MCVQWHGGKRWKGVCGEVVWWWGSGAGKGSAKCARQACEGVVVVWCGVCVWEARVQRAVCGEVWWGVARVAGEGVKGMVVVAGVCAASFLLPGIMEFTAKQMRGERDAKKSAKARRYMP